MFQRKNKAITLRYGALAASIPVSPIAALYYSTQFPPIRRGYDRINWLRRERGVEQN